MYPFLVISRPERDVYPLSLCNPEVENAWIFISAQPVRFLENYLCIGATSYLLCVLCSSSSLWPVPIQNTFWNCGSSIFSLIDRQFNPTQKTQTYTYTSSEFESAMPVLFERYSRNKCFFVQAPTVIGRYICPKKCTNAENVWVASISEAQSMLYP
jgi:hypothetical protein